MDPIVKALWFIVGNSRHDLALDDISAAAGVSRFHLTRAFGDVLHRPVMRYGPEFDSRSGDGGLEIWLPVRG